MEIKAVDRSNARFDVMMFSPSAPRNRGSSRGGASRAKVFSMRAYEALLAM